MAYDRQSLRITWGGQIGYVGQGNDVWQVGLHLAPATGTAAPRIPTTSEMTELFNDIVSPFHVAAGSNISGGALLQWVKAARVGTDGKYIAEPITFEGAATGGGGSTGTDGPQSSIALTLYSGMQLGRANYGRIYLPWWIGAVSVADGMIGTATVTALQTSAAAMLNAVNSWSALAFTSNVQVMNLSAIGAGTAKRVNYLRVGNVKDTQRRRRNRIKETYVSTTLAGAP